MDDSAQLRVLGAPLFRARLQRVCAELARNGTRYPGAASRAGALTRRSGSGEIVDHYERFVLALDEPPILIGHGIGGLVVQALLDRGLGICGVAVASAPIRGIWTLPYTKMRVVTPQLIYPRYGRRMRAPHAGAVPLRVHEQRLARGVATGPMNATRCRGRGACCCRRSSRTSIHSPRPPSTCGGTTARRC